MYHICVLLKICKTVSTTKLKAGADWAAEAPPKQEGGPNRTVWDFADDLYSPYPMIQTLRRAWLRDVGQ